MKLFSDFNKKRYLLFILACSLFLFLIGSLPDVLESPWVQFFDIVKIGLNFFVVFIVIYGICFFIGINKYVFLLFFPILTLLFSILAFFRYSTKTVLSASILDVTFTTDLQTSSELITFPLIIYVAFCFIISVFFVLYRFKKISFTFKKRKDFYICILPLLFLFLPFIPFVENRTYQKVPINLYFATKDYIQQRQVVETFRRSLLLDVECEKTDSLIVVFVLGESLRADHLGLNGYERNTTPNLQMDSVVSFSNIYSPHTYTNNSIPFIMTRANEQHQEWANEEKSFIEIFKNCGFYTSWLGNQESSDGYIYFMKEVDTLVLMRGGASLEKKPDGVLLPVFESVLKGQGLKQLIIIHTIGSHWWYNLRYEKQFAKFLPECKSSTMALCSREEIINSYDNSILYTDYFVHEIIDKLKDKKAVLFYLSDHGESLGENGQYLHASESSASHNSASFIWMSETYIKNNRQKYDCLLENKHQKYTTNYLFHSILDASGIKFRHFEEKESVFFKK